MIVNCNLKIIIHKFKENTSCMHTNESKGNVKHKTHTIKVIKATVMTYVCTYIHTCTHIHTHTH